jgi:Putative phage tail protein
MAREILTIGGQVLGASIAGPFGSAIGGIVGSAIGNAIDPPPDLTDRKVQISTYGANRPLLFGTVRTAGIMEWAADLVKGSDGGKGGPGEGPTYLGTFMCTLSRNRIKGIRRAWANGVPVYDDVSAEDKAVAPSISFAFYPGSETQLPDPTIESYEGVGEVPAYRGIGYVVISGMDLSKFGNRIPNMEFEVVSEQGWVGGDPVSFDSATDVTPSGFNWRYAFHRTDGTMLLVGGTTTGTVNARAFDPIKVEYGAALPLTELPHTMDEVYDCIYVPETERLYFCANTGVTTYVQEVSTADGSLLRTWIVSNTGFGDANIPPAGVWGGYLAYDPFHNALNITFTSQFTTWNLKRLDLNLGILGAAQVTSNASNGTGIVKGGSNVQVYLNTGGFSWRSVSPPLVDPRAWDVPPGETMRDVETLDEDGAGAALGDYTWADLVTDTTWPRGGSTATGTFPRGAYDTGRQRYVIFDSDGDVWTITDEESPTVTYQANTTVGDNGLFDVMYMSGLDALLVMSASGSVWVVDATDFSILLDGLTLPDASGGMPVMRQSLTDPGAIIVAGGPSLNAPYRLYEQPIYSTTVGAAVLAMGLDAGYAEADLDVSALTQRLRGFRVTQAGALRPAVEQLATVFHFEGCEEDDKIVFKMRGRASDATFEADDCVVQSADEQPISYARAQESSLPRRLTVTAPDMLSDYQPLTQRAERQAVQAGQDQQIAVDVVMTPTESKQAADALIFDAWTARETAEVTLTAAALRLTAGDVITLAGKRQRITGKTIDNMAVRLSLVADDEDMLDQTAAGVLAEFVRQSGPLLLNLDFEILHTPLLRDQDDDFGAYWAAWARTGTYPGARLLQTTADGTLGEWVDAESKLPAPGSAAGYSTNALGDWNGLYMVDESTVLNVQFFGSPPASVTRDAMLAGANAFMVGYEMVHAMNVVAQADGTHNLSGFLRVRRGTEQFGVDHVVGDLVVYLSPTRLGNFRSSGGVQGSSVLYGVTAEGGTAVTSDTVTTLYTARRLVPLAPVDVRGSRDIATDDLTITWHRRSRYTSRFCGPAGIYVPLGEITENYLVEIWDEEGGTLMRSIYVTEEEAVYTGAEQTTDFGSPPADVFVRVAQTRDRVPAALRWYYAERTL